MSVTDFKFCMDSHQQYKNYRQTIATICKRLTIYYKSMIVGIIFPSLTVRNLWRMMIAKDTFISYRSNHSLRDVLLQIVSYQLLYLETKYQAGSKSHNLGIV
ncbi:hypothetical protein HanXRQr2_Chr06g0277711 [Helianthus annuus]|uniref:Uncharacterized protein n=1 Tax=Helianthus annuus TaxID=4232 RepID=A0A251UKN6_HELAN|nr:hypothetical protein HanXRQr2_Chr06g0277711 [Helianthus annuus]KAJ0917034.1 hypothetical protein HanPSC8_Chr06g0268691 [Helianthus annuus]